MEYIFAFSVIVIVIVIVIVSSCQVLHSEWVKHANEEINGQSCQ